MTLTDNFSGAGSLTVTGTGTVFLSGSNTYAGGTTVNASGWLQLASSSALPAGGPATVNGMLELGGFGANIGALTGAGTIDHSGSGSNTLTVGTGNANGALAGSIENTGGSLGLLKVGSGQLILAGNDTYSGATTVAGGTLYNTGPTSLPAYGALIVGAGGTFIFDPTVSVWGSAEPASAAHSAAAAAPVPEPGALALLVAAALGIAGVFIVGRRRLPGFG